jgi:serine/threonine-protein kinase
MRDDGAVGVRRGTTFGEYELHDKIAVGGMAEVFRGAMRGAAGFERPVAIKRILPHLSSDPDFVKMFVDEAKIAVRLTHPNVVRILDLGRVGEDYYIAMELVDGRDMRAVQKRLDERTESIPHAITAHIAMKACEALHAAHTTEGPGGKLLGLIHRDVSPANVLVSFEGEVKVADFGLAKAAGRATQTSVGVVKGKLAYLSPEQAKGRDVDHRSDVFSAGICLWEWLAGRRCYEGRTDIEIALAAQRAEVPPVREIDPTVPAALDAVVMRALRRDPRDRWQTAGRMRDALEEASLELGLVTRQKVGAWMRGVFPEHQPALETTTTSLDIAATDPFVRRMHDTIPSGPIDPATMIEHLDEEENTMTGAPDLEALHTEVTPEPRRRR